jgi:hypothetical protein
MNCNLSLFFLSVLVFATPALAQAHKPAGPRPGPGGAHPGAVHPGQQHPGMMSSEQQMMHEFMMQQMMLNEMMSPRRGSRSHAQGQSMSGQNQSLGNPRPQARQPNQAKAAQGGSVGSNQQQPNQSSGSTSKHKAAEAKEARHEHERELAKEKSNERKSANGNRPSRAADNGTISLLKTVHSKLHRADADYQGHRVRAMEHIESAIHHLGSTSGLNMGLGGGDKADIGLGGGHVAQAESDQILRDAIFHLSQMQGSLGNGSNSAAHHRNAHTSVTEAIHELRVALEIR